MDLSGLPLINAILNAAATLLLVTGFIFIRNKKIMQHRACMLSAFVVSCLFLICYLVHKIWRATQSGALHTEYHGTGAIKIIYLVMLLTHVLLAMAVPVMAFFLINFAMRKKIEQHKRLAKIALPIWLYVSVTGVLIYLMLYPFNPAVNS